MEDEVGRGGGGGREAHQLAGVIRYINSPTPQPMTAASQNPMKRSEIPPD